MMENEYYLSPEDYEIAKTNGINYRQAYERFYKYGWTKQDAITRPIGSNALWPKYKELCQQNNVPQVTFYRRIRLGMDPTEAASLPPSRKYRLLGQKVKVTREMIAQAEENGITPNTFKYRVYKCRWDVERAMTEPVEIKYRRKTAITK